MDSDWLKEAQAEELQDWMCDRKQKKRVSWTLDVWM